MAHTFTQIYIQAVFAVGMRQSLIRPDFKEELQKYITGIIRKKGQKLIQINSMPDHTHILIGMKPSIALSDLIRDVKSDSTEFINGKRWIKGRFNWQEGFGAFSYEHSPPDGGLILPSAESIYLSSRVLSTGASSALSRCGVSATARY